MIRTGRNFPIDTQANREYDGPWLSLVQAMQPQFQSHVSRESTMKKASILITAFMVLAVSSLQAQTVIHGQPGTSYQTIGNSTFGSDGTSYQKIGNSTFGSDGSSSQRIGNSTFNSDGSSSTQVGNSLFNSNGTSVQRIGNSTFGSDGKSCQTIGSQTFCN